MDDDWPDPADLCRGLSSALATDDPAATDWAGELLVAVDRAIGEQVATIVTHDAFAPLHAAWRSVSLLTHATSGPTTSPAIEVQACDASAADWADGDAGWLHRLLYVGPLDTRGGHPIALLVAGSRAADLADVAERAICPAFVPEGSATSFVVPVHDRAILCPPLSADPAWAAWFDWPSVAGGPLLGSAAYTVAADAIRSVRTHGWPFDVADEQAGRLLMAARIAQIVAVRCRELVGRPPAEIAMELADGLRGRYVGPRLPLRRVDVAVETTGGRLACTLDLSPRLGGDDMDDVPITIRIELAAE